MSRPHALEIFADGMKVKGHPLHRDEPSLGDFVTVLQVTPPSDRKESYVTVLQVDKDTHRLQQNGGGIHEEPMAIYRLPGERLGMALKFEGGARPAEPVQRVFIQSIHPGSPAARAKGAMSSEPLREGDEILVIGDKGVVRTMTRGECVTLLRDAPVCIELVVRRHADRRKGPPPPVPPRKSPPLQTPPSADTPLPPLQAPPPELEGFHGVREKIQRLEAARKSRPSDPPPLPPRISIGKEFVLPPVSSQLQPELPDKMTGSSLSLRLPGWEELLQRRAETPRADLFMDLLAQEDDGDRSALESESDDTGSSVSTVIEKFSRGSTANSSFSELHQGGFDLRQVLSPFEQLERELDGVETPAGVQLGVIAPPENFQDGGQALTDEGSVSPISPPGDSGFLDMDEVDDDMLTNDYAVLQLCQDPSRTNETPKMNGFHNTNGLVESFMKREFMEVHQQGAEVTAFRMSGVQQFSVQENGVEHRNQTVQEKRTMRLTREKAVFDDDHEESHQQRRVQKVERVQSETIVRTSSRNDVTEIGNNKSVSTSLESLLSDESNFYENLSFTGEKGVTAFEEHPPAVPQKRETPKPPPIPPRLPKLSPTSEPHLNGLFDDLISYDSPGLLPNVVHEPPNNQKLSNGFHVYSEVMNNDIQSDPEICNGLHDENTPRDFTSTNRSEETVNTHPLDVTSRTTKTAVVRSLSLEEGRGLPGSARIRRSRSLSQGDDAVPGPRKSKSIGAYEGSRIPRPTFPVSSPRAGESPSSRKSGKVSERSPPKKNSRFGFEAGGRNDTNRRSPRNRNKSRKDISGFAETPDIEKSEVHPKPPRGPPAHVRSKSFEDPKIPAGIPEVHFVNGGFPSIKSPVMQSKSLDSDGPKSKGSPPSRHNKSKSMEILSQLVDTGFQKESIPKISSDSKTKTINSEIKKSPDSKPRSPDSKPRSRDSKLRSPDSKPRSPDSKARSPDSKPRSPNSKPKSSDTKLNTLDPTDGSPDFKPSSVELQGNSYESKPKNSELNSRYSESQLKSPEKKAKSLDSNRVDELFSADSNKELSESSLLANFPTTSDAPPEPADDDNHSQTSDVALHLTNEALVFDIPVKEGHEKQRHVEIIVPDANSVGSWPVVESSTAPEPVQETLSLPEIFPRPSGEDKETQQDLLDRILSNGSDDDEVTQFRVEVATGGVITPSTGFPNAEPFTDDKTFSWSLSRWPLQDVPEEEEPPEEETKLQERNLPDEDDVFLDDAGPQITRDQPDGKTDSFVVQPDADSVSDVKDKLGVVEVNLIAQDETNVPFTEESTVELEKEMVEEKSSFKSNSKLELSYSADLDQNLSGSNDVMTSKHIHKASVSALDKLLGLSSFSTQPSKSEKPALETFETDRETQAQPTIADEEESSMTISVSTELENFKPTAETDSKPEDLTSDTQTDVHPRTMNSPDEDKSLEDVPAHMIPIIAIEHVDQTIVEKNKVSEVDVDLVEQVNQDEDAQSQTEATSVQEEHPTDHPVIPGCEAAGDEDLVLQQQQQHRLPVVVDHVTKAEAAMHQGSLYRPPPEGHEFPPAYAEEIPLPRRCSEAFYSVPKTTRSSSLSTSNAANSVSVKDRIALFSKPDPSPTTPQQQPTSSPAVVQRVSTLKNTPKTLTASPPSPLSRWHSAASLLTSDRRPSYVSAYPETQLLRRPGYERSSSAATLLSSFLQDRRSSSSKLKGLVVPQGPAKVPAVPALPLIGPGASWRPAPLVAASFQLSHSKPVTPLTPEKPMPVSAVRSPHTPTSPPPPLPPTSPPPLPPTITAALPIKPRSDIETTRTVFRNPIERLDSLLGARVPALTIKTSSPVEAATVNSVSTNGLCAPSIATTTFVVNSSGSLSGPPSLSESSSLNGPSSLSPPPVPAQRTQSAPNSSDPSSSTSRARFWSLRDDSDDDSNSVISLRTEDSRQTADDSLSDADSLHQERSEFRPRRLSQQRTVLSVAPSRQAQQSTDSVRQFRALAEKWESRAVTAGPPLAPVTQPPVVAVPAIAPSFLFQPRSPRTPEPSKLPPSLQPRSIQDSKSSLLERSLSSLDLVGSRLLQKSSRSVSVSDIRKSFETKKQVSEHRRFSSMDSTASDSGVGTPGGLYGSASSLHAASGTPSRGGVGCSDSFGSATSLASDECCPATTSLDLQVLLDEAAVLLEGQGRHHQLTAVVLRKDILSGSVGITLAGGADYEIKDITVHKVISSSLADRDGRLRKGDLILSINGRPLTGLTHREALDLLKAHRQEVILITSRETSPSQTSTSSYEIRRKSTDTVKLSTTKTATPTPALIQQQISPTKSLDQDSSADKSDLPQGIVQLQLLKDGAGLGFSLEGGQGSPLGDKPLIVKRIFKGGAADREGHLRVGDEVLKVGSQSVTSMTRTEAWNFMKKLSDGDVLLTVRPLLQVPVGTLPN